MRGSGLWELWGPGVESVDLHGTARLETIGISWKSQEIKLNNDETHLSSSCDFRSISKGLNVFNAAKVLRTMFQIDLAVGRHRLTLSNISKPQYSSFRELPFARRDLTNGLTDS